MVASSNWRCNQIVEIIALLWQMIESDGVLEVRILLLQLLIRARDLIEGAGGVLVKNDAEQSSSTFTAPTD